MIGFVWGWWGVAEGVVGIGVGKPPMSHENPQQSWQALDFFGECVQGWDLDLTFQVMTKPKNGPIA